MLLELKTVSKSYESPMGKKPTVVLREISLRLDQGETLSVVGPSGSGKSTLLNIIGALDNPTSGEVLFDGKDLANCRETELANIRNRDMGFIFQLHHLLPQCTVLENVLIPTIPLKMREDGEKTRDRAKELLAKVGLEDRLGYFPAQLSGGELQRVAVIRALINRPKLVLADEPTGSLDKAASENLGRLLVRLNEDEGTALIVVTHSLDLARLMGRLSHLRDGRLEKDASS